MGLHLRALTLLGSISLLGACGTGRSAEGGSTEGSTVSGTEGAGTSTDSGSDANSGSDTDSSDTDSSDTGAPMCGDGIVEGDELCDPGTGEPGSCTTGCPVPERGCNDQVYSCGDTVDNDDDGLIDLWDPDCLSPCDDTEDAFAPELPGQDWTCLMDCHFDADVGHGNDTCEKQHRCDSLDPGQSFGCEYDPNFPACEDIASPQCLEVCLPLTANGCDCYGCCEVDGIYRYVGNGSLCGSDDPSQCLACTPSQSCINICEPERCELCFLQTIEQLAPGCDAPSCPGDTQPCTNPYACPAGEFCQAGCCRPIEP